MDTQKKKAEEEKRYAVECTLDLGEHGLGSVKYILTNRKRKLYNAYYE